LPHCLYEQPEAWTANTELTPLSLVVDGASTGLSWPTSTSKPPTECEEDCQEGEVEEDKNLCEVFILEDGRAREDLRFLDRSWVDDMVRFLRNFCLTIADDNAGFRLVTFHQLHIFNS